ncbi:nitroreductase family protein [Pectinatus haikarae]|uniref:Nitroreductase n=1 Tax=Pectinatus haikarae TaxID=349096 RepID=A0ABT9Y580_9FIRM|nr:nitroreductase family protein [Pectinatus haikarae]MDQ0202982.1 nitroreductase [Pectinatus haikarae]
MKEIFTRTSVRAYEARPVEDEKVEFLLKAAMAAPSAGNQQPWEFYVIRDSGFLQELAKSSPYTGCVKKAPLAIVPCYNKERLLMPEYADIDMSAAAENILLAAESADLGAVWLGIAPIKERMETVEKILSIPAQLKAFAIISIGYPQKKGIQQDRFDSMRIHYSK